MKIILLHICFLSLALGMPVTNQWSPQLIQEIAPTANFVKLPQFITGYWPWELRETMAAFCTEAPSTSQFQYELSDDDIWSCVLESLPISLESISVERAFDVESQTLYPNPLLPKTYGTFKKLFPDVVFYSFVYDYANVAGGSIAEDDLLTQTAVRDVTSLSISQCDGYMNSLLPHFRNVKKLVAGFNCRAENFKKMLENVEELVLAVNDDFQDFINYASPQKLKKLCLHRC